MKFCFEKKTFIELEIEPHKLAVQGTDGKYNWQQFHKRVNDIISYFKEFDLDRSFNPVVIYGHKSSDMVAGIYACIAMNIPYVPVDIAYPDDRVQKIIDSSKCNLLLNTTSERLQQFNTSEVHIESNLSYFPLESKFNSQSSNTLGLVYIIFTSGSTGEPKGVQLDNEAVRSFTKWMTSSDYQFSSADTFINTALLSFDLSVFEVMTFGALGGSILLNSKEECGNQDLLLNKIENYSATVWISTPSFAFLYSRLDPDQRLNSVHTFLFCGEVLPHSLAKDLLVKYQPAKVINTYGPTEATVATTIVKITPDIIEKFNPLPVGYSKMDSQIILDKEEIVIVGPNVSVGYINRPDLNSEKFITINNQKAFKTGDKGYLEDNMLFFHGRNDDMVKLHGYRIEINEITSVLHNLSYVIQAATVALERGGIVKKIVSLVVIKPKVNKTVAQIKDDLKKNLPDYMIPSDIKEVDTIPLNQNGKADKKALIEIYLGK
ncbi:MAG: AMP-binding protein [Crocinitomicaceae bacterium]